MDQTVFEAIVHEHARFIRCTLLRRGVRACDLDDIAQDVLLAVFRGLSAFAPSRAGTPDRAVRAWVYGICERQAANYRRRMRRRPEIPRDNPNLDAFCDTAPNAEDHFLACEHRAALGRALGAMDPNRRDVMVAHELCEVPMGEIAHRQGVSINTVWNRLRLARADIRAALQCPARRKTG